MLSGEGRTGFTMVWEHDLVPEQVDGDVLRWNPSSVYTVSTYTMLMILENDGFNAEDFKWEIIWNNVPFRCTSLCGRMCVVH